MFPHFGHNKECIHFYMNIYLCEAFLATTMKYFATAFPQDACQLPSLAYSPEISWEIPFQVFPRADLLTFLG